MEITRETEVTVVRERMQASTMKVYIVTIKCHGGKTGELELRSTLGPEAAGRRALFAAAHLRWGDVDELEILDVREV